MLHALLFGLSHQKYIRKETSLARERRSNRKSFLIHLWVVKLNGSKFKVLNFNGIYENCKMLNYWRKERRQDKQKYKTFLETLWERWKVNNNDRQHSKLMSRSEKFWCWLRQVWAGWLYQQNYSELHSEVELKSLNNV